MGLASSFDAIAMEYGDAPCLSDYGGASFSFSEVKGLTDKIASALHASGLREGSKVAVYSPNCALGFAAILGVFRSGGVWTPINAKFSRDEVVSAARQFDVDWLFYHSSFKDEIAGLLEIVPSIRGVICIDRRGTNAPSLEEWAGANDKKPPALQEKGTRLAMLAATGGTTGTPKGVCLTERCFNAMTASYHTLMPVQHRPTHLVAAPMTHAAGFTAIATVLQGGEQVFMPQVDVEQIMQLIESRDVTHIFLPPTVIYMMLAHPRVADFDYSSLEYFLYAAAPMSEAKLRQAMAIFGPVMTQCFGQVEAPMMCTYLSKQDHRRAVETGQLHRLSSCGKPGPFIDVSIMSDNGELLGNNEQGEIVLRGDLVMDGYYNDPDATAKAEQNGWLLTGDIGHIDDDGFVYIVDRKKDMIISGGFNVFPKEIEDVIWTHPSVQDCAVIGIPDEKWGEAVTAVVEAVEGEIVDSDEVISMCKEKLGSVKAPKTVHVWEQLPRSPVGKVLKKEIRRKFWRGEDRLI
ncbi:MAG: AMP-binding protein [Pseudomonadota bacterium]